MVTSITSSTYDTTPKASLFLTPIRQEYTHQPKFISIIENVVTRTQYHFFLQANSYSYRDYSNVATVGLPYTLILAKQSRENDPMRTSIIPSTLRLVLPPFRLPVRALVLYRIVSVDLSAGTSLILYRHRPLSSRKRNLRGRLGLCL
jgi:hypothetical protein